MNNNRAHLTAGCVDQAEKRLVEGGGRLKVTWETPPNIQV